MAQLLDGIGQINRLERFASGDTAVHRLHPMAKLIATFFYIAAVLSFGGYDPGGLIPYLFYPLLLMALSETPCRAVLGRLALALPFVLPAAIANVVLDTKILLHIGGLPVSGGALSLISILLKTFLTVSAVLILIATTPVHLLYAQLRWLGAPELFVTLIEMTSRYVGVLIGEGFRMRAAYVLRAPAKKAPELRDAGPLLGQLLLRSVDRAERIYSAMKCRGYGGAGTRRETRPMGARDIAFLCVIPALSLFFRIVPAAELLGRAFI